MSRLRVAVVGLGIGRQHLEAYAARPELFEIAALCDLDPARLAATADEFGVSRRVSDYDSLLAEGGIDVVNLCTPPMTHFEMVAKALRAGVHAVCEKPLVGSLRDCDRLAEVEKETGRRIIPIFQYRFGNGLQRLKMLVDMGLAGEAMLSTIETSWLRGADYYAVPWRGRWATELGGVCISQAIHAHDMLCYVVGPIASVQARLLTRVNPIEAEDCAAVAVEMADGSLATLSATLGSAIQISRLRFVFRNLTAESNLDPYRPSRDPWTFTGVTPERQAEIDAALATFVPREEFFESQFVRMREALLSGAEPPVTLADARASLELITGIYHSAETGERAVFPIGPDHPRYAGWASRPGAFRKDHSA